METTGITREQILNMLTTRPVDFGRACGFRKLTDLHNDWLLKMLYSKHDRTFLSHRGSYKTTDLSVFFALNLIINPWQTVMYFRKTDTDVKEVCRQTAKLLHTGAAAYIIKKLYDVDFRFLAETDNRINTNLNKSLRGASQIVGSGIHGSITGKHADIICTDDIVNVKDRVSRAERERTKLQYMELQNIKNRGGRIINTGTPWHKDDCIGVHFEKETLTQRWTCYDTGLMTPEEIAKLKERMSPSLFAANYELKHIADEQAIFQDPFISEDEEDAARIWDGIAHVDAAYGGEDYTALTIAQEHGRKYWMFGKLYEGHVDDHIEDILAMCDKYRAGTIYCERNADKGFLAEKFEERGAYVQTYHESQNKYIKIVTHLKNVWKDITWLNETDSEYLAQIVDYTERAGHDDAPDSAASLIRILTEYSASVTGYDI